MFFALSPLIMMSQILPWHLTCLQKIVVRCQSSASSSVVVRSRGIISVGPSFLVLTVFPTVWSVAFDGTCDRGQYCENWEIAWFSPSLDEGLPCLKIESFDSLFPQLLFDLLRLLIDFIECVEIMHHHLLLYFLAQSFLLMADLQEIFLIQFTSDIELTKFSTILCHS